MRNLCIVFLMIVIVIAGGCISTVPLASPNLDLEAKKFKSNPGNANIYIHWGYFVGAAEIFQIIIDGRMAGGIAPYTYHLISVKPGPHSIVVIGAINSEQVDLTAEEGKNYFYDLTPGLGAALHPKVHIKPISEEEGISLIIKSKRAETIIYK